MAAFGGTTGGVLEGFYVRVLSSGLYDRLASDGLLLPHEPASPDLALTPDAHAVIKPRALEFVS